MTDAHGSARLEVNLRDASQGRRRPLSRSTWWAAVIGVATALMLLKLGLERVSPGAGLALDPG